MKETTLELMAARELVERAEAHLDDAPEGETVEQLIARVAEGWTSAARERGEYPQVRSGRSRSGEYTVYSVDLNAAVQARAVRLYKGDVA